VAGGITFGKRLGEPKRGVVTDRPTLRRLDLEAWAAAEQARVDALDPGAAATALLGAVDQLAREEAMRLGVPFLDPTYHGCAPAWRRVLHAAADLQAVLGRGDA
jgi:hypothetical protein